VLNINLPTAQNSCHNPVTVLQAPKPPGLVVQGAERDGMAETSACQDSEMTAGLDLQTNLSPQRIHTTCF